MGHETLIHGAIIVPGRKKGLSETFELNRRAIEALPHADTFPFLTRDAFGSLAEWRMETSYQSGVLPFGLSLKWLGPELEYDTWRAWKLKFEHLLMNMSWQQAFVHIVPELYQSYSCYWSADRPYDDETGKAWTYRVFSHGLPDQAECELQDGL